MVVPKNLLLHQRFQEEKIGKAQPITVGYGAQHGVIFKDRDVVARLAGQFRLGKMMYS